ncbi:MAG: PAS domain-containing protein [Deltaproteobacteria bacterium]
MLYKSERLFQDITAFLAEGIFVLNESGEITFMTPEAERLLGWTASELENKNAHDIIQRHGKFSQAKHQKKTGPER